MVYNISLKTREILFVNRQRVEMVQRIAGAHGFVAASFCSFSSFGEGLRDGKASSEVKEHHSRDSNVERQWDVRISFQLICRGIFVGSVRMNAPRENAA